MSGQITYTFDLAAVTTFKVTTDAGEDAARRAADMVIAISVAVTSAELDLEDDIPVPMTFDVTTVAPRGRAYLVDAEDVNGQEVSISGQEWLPEPVSLPTLDELTAAIMAGDSVFDGAPDSARSLAEHIITELRKG